jgi:hypothetical protein
MMNDAMTATDAQETTSKEAHEFVELGRVSDETRGTHDGELFDGGGGWFG